MNARDLLVRTLLLVLVWWALVEGEGGGWIVAALVIGSALWMSLRLVQAIRWRLHPAGVVRFVPFFLAQSLVGGIDVARRALSPRLPLSPGFIDYGIHLSRASARRFFVGTISLLPGTLSVQLIEEDAEPPRVRVHLLDREAQAEAKLRELEVRVADLFDIEA